MWLWFTLAALAAEPQDLPGIAKAWGFQSVAVLVRSANQGDRSLSDVHARLASMGLDRVKMVVEADKTLVGLGTIREMTGCGWNQGVACRLDLPAGAPNDRALAAACANRKGLVDAPLSLVTDPAPSSTAGGTAWVADLLPCWEAGGDRIRLVPAFPAPKFTVLINDGFDAAAVESWLLAKGSALGGCGAGLALVASPTESGVGVEVKRDGVPHAGATACVRALWGEGPGEGKKLVIAW